MGIAEVAQNLGYTLRTLRFYEERGLISVKRNGSARLYDAGTVGRLEYIKKLSELHFTLAEISEIIGSCRIANRLCLSEDTIDGQVKYLNERVSSLLKAIQELEKLRGKGCGVIGC